MQRYRFKVLNNIEGDAKTEEEYEALKAKHSGERGAIHARIETLKPYLK